MLKVKSKNDIREVVISGTQAELKALAEALNNHMSWAEAEESEELIPEDFFCCHLYDALRDGQ